MPQIARLIGGAGTGKTSELLRLMDHAIDKYFDPHLVGFVSFTRAARREASSRAADRYGIRPDELEQQGWFKTLHSVCFKVLGESRKSILTDSTEGRKWVENALQESVDCGLGSFAGDFVDAFNDGTTPASCALSLWESARNRLLSLRDVWEGAVEIDRDVPELDFCEYVVNRYEQAKRLDGLSDFTDLLTRFAGWRMTVEGPDRKAPEGVPPGLPVWLLDEQQDASPLLHSVCQRLVESCEWCYIVGDPFQSIYGWMGAEPKCFMDGWKVDKQKIMPKSWRCPEPILRLGEEILRRCSDYWDRGIAPADHPGIVKPQQSEAFFSGIDSLLYPPEKWLMLCRTNKLCGFLGAKLTAARVPWKSSFGGGFWVAPVRNMAVQALWNLERGAPIDGMEWKAILKHIPSTIPGGKLLERGTKKTWESLTDEQAQESRPWMTMDDLGSVGATELLLERIRQGVWNTWMDGAVEYQQAVARFGEETVNNPPVTIGTVHSAKGAECDNVAVLTTIPWPVYRNTQRPAGYDEEQRVKYVAVTRARKRLIVVSDPTARHQWSNIT